METGFAFVCPLSDKKINFADAELPDPRALSINNAEAIQDIYGYTSKCTKGPFYDLNYPGRSLHMTRDRKFHSQRRKLWDRAFTTRGRSKLFEAVACPAYRLLYSLE